MFLRDNKQENQSHNEEVDIYESNHGRPGTLKKCAQNPKWFPCAHLYTKTISHTSCIGRTNCSSTSFVLNFPFANYLMELLIQFIHAAMGYMRYLDDFYLV